MRGDNDSERSEDYTLGQKSEDVLSEANLLFREYRGEC